MGSLFIGLMSGTSLDGIDGVAVDFAATSAPARVQVVSHAKRALSPDLRARLAALNRSGDDEIHRAALAANALARDYAALVETLRTSAAVANAPIVAIGCHGQTIRHRPREFDGVGYTIQLNAPALLAELTGIDVIADFRSRDVAAGGQGAPLVPAFHRAIFGRAGATVAVLNLGGIANLTVLGPGEAVIGFDCGRPTPCSTSGASARPAAPSTATARRRPAASSIRACSTRCSPSLISRWRRRRARGSISSTPPGSTRDSTPPTHARACARKTFRRRSPSSAPRSSRRPAGVTRLRPANWWSAAAVPSTPT
jgi:anhydro-N-acetylmuramic acid kinase